MQKLHFSANHNGKLFLDHFPTVRLHNPGKYFIGNDLEAELKTTPLGIVTVVAVRTFRYKQVSDVLAYLDTGRPAQYLAGLIKAFYEKKIDLNAETKLDHVILNYKERHLLNHSLLLQAWFNELARRHQKENSQTTLNFSL